ncbi:hypothetical protein ABZ816_08470 [Actinosynnema sp. NPDC047251]|uniref:Uncharacterized protein n=1 Tax=Saccharothrix espanaensis (strain ATCC 51144 / DSM 44229 / JCM 9112 / NBRC 15066 / NRRL 15764) TaxID=1179773 RepID=K0KAJ0_SACES|nr:hypothetical protein [Saccharothrix espanaensis]CCH33844.1 hypothetical protein BN6_66070 [Saccharothrix espanaensis DSM 44229]
MRSLGPRMEVAVAMTILGVGAAVVAAMHLTWPEPELPAMAYAVSNGEAGVADLQPFEINDISGAPVELTPGSEGSRRVRLSNPNSVDIVVLTLQAVPGQPLDAAHNRVVDCPSGVLTVVPMAQPVALPPAGSVEVEMVVQISPDVPPACKDSVFPLTYTGRAARG